MLVAERPPGNSYTRSVRSDLWKKGIPICRPHRTKRSAFSIEPIQLQIPQCGVDVSEHTGLTYREARLAGSRSIPNSFGYNRGFTAQLEAVGIKGLCHERLTPYEQQIPGFGIGPFEIGLEEM